MFQYPYTKAIPYDIIYQKSNTVIIKSLTPDISGPFVSKIVRVPGASVNLNLTPNQAVGWSVSVEDKVNGFSHGYIIAIGSKDGSINNFTLKSESSDKSITFNLILEEISCVSQTITITEVVLYDTSGFISSFKSNKAYSNREYSGDLDSPINPLLNYFGPNKDNLTIGIECTESPESTGPELVSIEVNKENIDVGSNDRSLSFTMVFNDPETGINRGQLPIVYITSLYFEHIKCISNLVSCQKDIKTCTFKCETELPFGYSYPNNLTFQIYGALNNGGFHSGYSYFSFFNKFNKYPSIQVEFSTNIPVITQTNRISNEGGNLLIMGQYIGDAKSVLIKYSNAKSITLAPTCSDTSYCTIQVPESDLSFTIQIELKDNSKSNEFKITPVYVTKVIPQSSSSLGSSSLVSSFSLDPINSSSSQEYECPGKPVCGGASNGYCTTKGCVCISPWFGLECKQKVIIVPQPSFNNTDPNITVIVPNENNADKVEYTSLTSIISIREVDKDKLPFQKHSFEKWVNNRVGNSVNEYYSNFTNINNSSKTTQVKVIVEWFEKQTNISFASEQLDMNPSSVKYTIEIIDYPFQSILNSLEIVMSASFKSNDKTDGCSSKEFGDTNGWDNSNYLKIQVNDHSLYARFIKRGVINGRSIVTVSNSILDDSFKTVQDPSQATSFIAISIPYFSSNATIDPDFSILLDQSKSSSSVCKSKLSSTQIAGIIIGAVGFVAVVAICIIGYYIKKKRAQIEMDKLSIKLKNMDK
ncbi:hypothetical protein DICPUDRAFT_40546 [Dictyostelium purpureum]|uniref:EGF-like domain-containing protein n=1 Tax=Dictyostelium purpureum TaxID=5786 RepID=F0ZYD9_DICPU|nr:uncharacterized protein DICPUDRAFT_40546 [Dictyostelium purpureum]EGC31042.1 hypothetical protein DICPUDRAFT_40546 [Dictyostelium purpureum]|eukprot:XP_003292430.1 hypothetical protein DICPUDRAFT_40546 [Dictyostelium purpureum]